MCLKLKTEKRKKNAEKKYKFQNNNKIEKKKL